VPISQTRKPLFLLASQIVQFSLIFGAFMLGAMMPKQGGFVRELTDKIEDFAVVFLLPVYFAYTGLRTQVGLLDSGDLWLFCVLIIGMATIGKFGGSAVAARVTGLGWREASALGVLMNTRGLMELIILNIGLMDTYSAALPSSPHLSFLGHRNSGEEEIHRVDSSERPALLRLGPLPAHQLRLVLSCTSRLRRYWQAPPRCDSDCAPLGVTVSEQSPWEAQK